MTLDIRPVLDWEDPVGNHLRPAVGVLLSALKKAGPRICARRGCVPILADYARYVLPHRVAFVAMNAPFALLQIHRVTRKIPVNDSMAVGMEIQTFLADGSGCEHERPEGRVEGGTHRFFAKLRFVF